MLPEDYDHQNFLIYTCLLFIVWQIILRTLLVLESKFLLRQILQFRGLALPRQCKPLVIQMLAHNGFKSAVKTFIRQQMMGFKTFLVPFHLPSTQVVAGKAESIKDILYNHLRLQKSWSWTTPPRCPCSNFCVQHLNYKRPMDILLHRRAC